MIIRLASYSDASELKRLNDLFNGEGCNTVKAIEESIKKNEQEIICVADDGNKLVGVCCGQILKSMCYAAKYGEITEIYVEEEYRRQGIGRKLLITTESELSERGVKHFHILTGEENITAQTLYNSCGYAKTTKILFDKD